MQSFLQAAAIKLSFFGASIPADVQADLDIVDAFLATLPCLSGASALPSATNADASAAAKRISDWIALHHCF
jgi:hypothetical protein